LRTAMKMVSVRKVLLYRKSSQKARMSLKLVGPCAPLWSMISSNVSSLPECSRKPTSMKRTPMRSCVRRSKRWQSLGLGPHVVELCVPGM